MAITFKTALAQKFVIGLTGKLRRVVDRIATNRPSRVIPTYPSVLLSGKFGQAM
jgi:hypothetical protein